MVNTADTLGLGRRLKVARVYAGLEQQEIADALGVSRSTVSAWEVGRTEPSASNFAHWAALTGQSMEWLATGSSGPGDATVLQASTMDAEHLGAARKRGALAFAG